MPRKTSGVMEDRWRTRPRHRLHRRNARHGLQPPRLLHLRYRQFSSRIKGGHSNYKIRIGTEPVASTSSDTDVLVAIDQETIDRNHHELVPGSYRRR